MVDIKKVVPTEPPPATFMISGLTYEELLYIRIALLAMAGNDSEPGYRRLAAREMHDLFTRATT
jgi:hypothetical protein